MKSKGISINAGKTKDMIWKVRKVQVENSGKYPCSACKKGVGSNSLVCVEFQEQVEKRCSK